VAYRSLTTTTWNGTLLGPDPSSEAARLKNQNGKNVVEYGTSGRDDTLVPDQLIDEFRFWSRPSWPAYASGCSKTWTPQCST
jgi:hypothetical protein